MEQATEKDKQLTVEQMFQSLKNEFDALRKQNQDQKRQLKLAVKEISRNLKNETDPLRKQIEDQQRQLNHLRRNMGTALRLAEGPNALQTSTMTQFKSFNNLPLEIREMIWELAVPSRLVRFAEASEEKVVPSALSAPAVAHVCRESRRVVTSRKRVAQLSGRSHHLGAASELWRIKHDSGLGAVHWTWFTPYKDVLLANPDSLMWANLRFNHFMIRVAEHIIIEDCGIWEEFLRPESERQEEPVEMVGRLHHWWGEVRPEPECPTPPGGPVWNLRTVDFAMTSVTKIDRNYPPNFVRRLFVGESVRIVDLRDANTVHGIIRMMVDEVSQFMDPDQCWPVRDGLQESLKRFNAINVPLFKDVRKSLLNDMVAWYYKDSTIEGPLVEGSHQESRDTLPWPFDSEHEVNMEVTWVKELTRRINIRPVHVFVRVDGMSREVRDIW